MHAYTGADPRGVDWVSSHPPTSLNVDETYLRMQ